MVKQANFFTEWNLTNKVNDLYVQVSVWINLEKIILKEKKQVTKGH